MSSAVFIQKSDSRAGIHTFLSRRYTESMMWKKGIGLLAFIFLFSGCSIYVPDYSYVPHPAMADVPPNPPQTSPPISVSATIAGVRYDDHQNAIPSSVELRLRMDNNGPNKVVFDPMSLELSNSELVRFPQPIVRPPTPINLAPGESAYLTGYFPFPPNLSYDTMDLTTLQLRWYVQVADKWTSQSVYFHRVPPYYYGPYWSYWGPPPPPFYYGGVVVVHVH